MSTPERIWAYPSYVTGWDSATAHDRKITNSAEYVRADLLTAAQAEIARLTAERDAAMAGRVKVKPLVQAVNAVLSSAGDEGSRAGLNMGPNGEDIWIDYMEVGKLELDAMATALAALQPAPAPEAQEIALQEAVEVLPNSWNLARVMWEARKYAAWGKDAGSKLIERTPWQNHAAHPLVATEHELAHAEAKAALRAIAAMQKGGWGDAYS